MTEPMWLSVVFVAFVLGSLGTLGLVKWLEASGRRDARCEAERILAIAQDEAQNKKDRASLEAKEAALTIKADAEKKIAAAHEKVQVREQKLDQRDEKLHQWEESLRKQARGNENTQLRLTNQLEAVNKEKAELESLKAEQTLALQEVSRLSREEATERLMSNLESELEQEIGTAVLRHQRRVTERADAKAREILLTAIQRYAAAHTAESTTSTVDIPTDDMKGRIIGREGRNIRSFEKATGVDVIIDDTPGVVIVSGFDPVRREIGRLSLNKLISDGRIHPSRIEEVVAATEKEIDAFIMQKGREAIEEVNIPGPPEKVVQMLGRLHFRTSYSQNVLRHSIEVAFLSGLLAEMIGLDGDLARHCGLLHDIGKAADHELEGGHPKIGADLLKRHKQPPEVVHAALGHHDEIVTEHPYTMLVATADACSASRPGARRESLERYIKRMEELESIASSFEGVRQAFAIQAGRELRVIVGANNTDDSKAALICRKIANAFEQQLTYPGEIKVTVVRESRFTEVAR
ncbi:MAG: ribonuclease Y [Pirellulaceae bacterium]